MLEEVRLLNVSSEFEFGEEIAERGGRLIPLYQLIH